MPNKRSVFTAELKIKVTPDMASLVHILAVLDHCYASDIVRGAIRDVIKQNEPRLREAALAGQPAAKPQLNPAASQRDEPVPDSQTNPPKAAFERFECVHGIRATHRSDETRRPFSPYCPACCDGHAQPYTVEYGREFYLPRIEAVQEYVNTRSRVKLEALGIYI